MKSLLKTAFSSGFVIALILPALWGRTAWQDTGLNPGAERRGQASSQDHILYLPLLVFNSEMVLIPAGEFQMGCHPDHNAGYTCPPDERPLHTVYLDAYWIDRWEVSNEKYARCVRAGACSEPGEDPVGRPPYFGDPAYSSYPVAGVSWSQAKDYCTWGASACLRKPNGRKPPGERRSSLSHGEIPFRIAVWRTLSTLMAMHTSIATRAPALPAATWVERVLMV